MSLADCHPVAMPVRTTEPTVLQEPVSLDEARRQCSIGEGVTGHDETLRGLIAAARAQVEQDAGLVCYTGSHTYKLSEWPDADWFDLPIRPVTSITSIAYIDTDGTSQTLATSVYQLETANVKQFVRLKYSQNWPALRGDINGITVTLVAGYATVAAIPQRVKQACLLLISHWFENRSPVGNVGQEIALSYNALINSLGRPSYP